MKIVDTFNINSIKEKLFVCIDTFHLSGKPICFVAAHSQ